MLDALVSKWALGQGGNTREFVGSFNFQGDIKSQYRKIPLLRSRESSDFGKGLFRTVSHIAYSDTILYINILP